MEIIRCGTVAELNRLAADALISDLQSRPKSIFCAATGNSPTGIYELLGSRRKELGDAEIHLRKLDEWCGLPMEHPATCEHYLQKFLVRPLGLPGCSGFDSGAADPAAECQRVQALVASEGPADICVLGLGANGHIAFNEPAGELEPAVHLAALSETSLNHSMVKGSGYQLRYGYTLGMADILASAVILLPVFGKGKREIMSRFLQKKISTQLPASFLWLHPRVTCYYCENDQ